MLDCASGARLDVDDIQEYVPIAKDPTAGRRPVTPLKCSNGLDTLRNVLVATWVYRAVVVSLA